MHLSKTQSYAIHLLRALRRSPGLVMKNRLAKRLGISEGMVQQVMIPLLAAGLVTSSQSSTAGGYMLANRRRRITVAQVLEALPQAGGADDKFSRQVERIVVRTLDCLRVDDL